jgi:hypothetical protein
VLLLITISNINMNTDGSTAIITIAINMIMATIGWLKIIQNNSQGGGSFAYANRFALLSRLVCSSVEGVAKYFSKQLPRGWELCFGESVCPFVLVGLLFCGGGG